MSTVSILNGLEFLYPDNIVVAQLKRTLDNFPECEEYLVDAFSIGQIKSKLWLLDYLPDNLGTVFICAGWYGTLASLMFERHERKFDKIRSFDIDQSCASIADTINKPWVIDGWRFKASTLDILTMEYPTTHTTYRSNGTSLELHEMPDTIINTSCEHIRDFETWYGNLPNDVLLVMQSNNYYAIDDHVNCSSSLIDFSSSTPMNQVLYKGELKLDKYTRYMKIGYK